MTIPFLWGGVLAGAASAAWLGRRALGKKQMDRWLLPYMARRLRQAWNGRSRPTDVLLAICDHFEPEQGRGPSAEALERVDRWVEQYPVRFDEFRDVSGRPPLYSFFFPQDEYQPEYLDRLADLCHAGYGDVEVHLHHDHDTADGLREKLERFKELLYHRHGLLRRDPWTREIVYGFIHGNWALCNARRDGRWCGVDQELTVLRETGCYADFTFPAYPVETQPALVNRIYYAHDRPGRSGGHLHGIEARCGGLPPVGHLLLIQGPMTVAWHTRRLRVDNACLQRSLPPSRDRFRTWLQTHVHVAGRSDWAFIKLHAHGCKPGDQELLLGPAMQAFYREILSWCSMEGIRLHFVTAWEMAQAVHLAERQPTPRPYSPFSSGVHDESAPPWTPAAMRRDGEPSENDLPSAVGAHALAGGGNRADSWPAVPSAVVPLEYPR